MDPKNMITRSGAVAAQIQWKTVLLLIRGGVSLNELEAVAQSQAEAFGKLIEETR